MYKLECNYCPKIIEREKNIPNACCFDCRMIRNRRVANKAAAEKRQLRKSL